jgi:hypothetical protein
MQDVIRPKSLLIVALFARTMSLCAQDTAFTYQGQLNASGSPVNGNYDFTFALFRDSNTNGSQVGNTLTNLAVGVTNGLFMVTLDFGANFPGASRWLAIGVRINGGENFTDLVPLLPVTPTPYAITAGTASNALIATVLTGTVSGGSLSGVYTNAVTLNNSSNSFFGTFSGDGSLLTNTGPFINVLQNGVTNDGVTDNTTALQALLNKGGFIYFPPGRYCAHELQVIGNTTLWGAGPRASVLVYATDASSTNIFVRCGLNTNITIFNLGFDGGDYSDITTRTFNNYGGSLALSFTNAPQMTYWNPYGLRHGLQINTTGGGVTEAITIYGFNGIGMLPVSQAGTLSYSATKTIITGVECYTNFCGLFSSANLNSQPGYPNWIINYVADALVPEYTAYSAMNLHDNAIGMCFSAGNCTMMNSTISHNYFNQLDTFGLNDHHGSISTCSYNHAIFFDIFILGAALGEQWDNCQFRGGVTAAPEIIYLNDTAGMNFNNCSFDAFAFTNTASTPSGVNSFRFNTYFGTWANQTFSTDGQLLYDGNHSANVAGDTDGQPLTLVELGNASGLTNLNANNIVGGITTNIIIGGQTFYYTNGVLMNIR